jgi:hypothetical protein
MHLKPKWIGSFGSRIRGFWFHFAFVVVLFTRNSQAVGTWVPLNNFAPDGINTMLLLPDGTVMAAGGQPAENTFSQAWYRLTPDSTGSYVNGTWSTLAPMHYPRLYYSSQVLTNGEVFIAGAEYSTDLFTGPGTTNAEIYNPIANTWTLLPNTPGYNAFYDSCSEMLPSGNVLISPVGPATFGGTLIWNTASNTWSNGPRLYRGDNEDEATWVKLPDNSILTIDPYGTNSERYVPSFNKWFNDTNVPVVIYDSVKNEMGTALLLPNGQAFFTGATGHTALYTPSGTTNMGMWAAGPDLPNSEVMADAPAAMMVNGRALLVMSSAVYNTNSDFYEYDPVANAYNAVSEPSSYISTNVTFGLRMLDLPDGTVLLSNGGSLLYVYQPDGSPLSEGQPVINSLTKNANGSYHLTGTLLNGITEGAAYGDDAQMNSNYPLVRTTNSAGQVIYARTFNWNSTSVMTGTNVASADFAMPASASYGIYSLVVAANGNASAPMTFIYAPDTLLVAYTSNLLFTGTNGGPFTPTSISFTLTNVGASSLNWAAGSSASWLTPSLASGTLTPGGPTTTVTVSLNSAANSLAFGTYNGNILFTNLSDNFVQTNTFTLVANSPQLVKNGGFESGNFNNWTPSGDNDGNEFVYNDSSYAHSGNYCALFQPHTGLYYLSQNITTTPGQLYLVSFWMLNYFNASPSDFLVNWAGTNLVNLTNVAPNYAWTQMQYLVTATGSSSALQFGIQYDGTTGQYLGLDDVSVTEAQVPKFQLPLKSNGSVNLTWGAMYGETYQLQYTTNLAFGAWTNLGGPVNASNATVTATDITPSDQQRYYRLILLP